MEVEGGEEEPTAEVKKERKKEEENKIKEFKFIAPAFIKQCYRG